MIITVNVRESINLEQAKIEFLGQSKFRKFAAKAMTHIDKCRKYSLDHIIFDRNRILLYFYAHEKKFVFNQVFDNTFEKDNQGENWVHSVDSLQEHLRKKITANLKKTLTKEVCVESTWTPGKGIFVTGGIVGDGQSRGTSLEEQRTLLEEELWSLRSRQESINSRKKRIILYLLLLPFSVIILLFIVTLFIEKGNGSNQRVDLTSSLSYLFENNNTFLFIILIMLYAFLALFIFSVQIVALRGQVKTLRGCITETLVKIDLLGLTNDKQKHAYKLFQINTGELKQYYDQALRQKSWVFVLGIVSMISGFVIIILTIYAIINIPLGAALESTVVIAIIGGVGSFLSNFVAVIFLRMFSDIVASTAEFHLRLVGTHHAHFGNVLAARIQDQKLEDETLGKLALALISPKSGSPASI